jgi:hypothetical protein
MGAAIHSALVDGWEVNILIAHSESREGDWLAPAKEAEHEAV